MDNPVAWLDDGTPRSTRFDDIYRSTGADGQGGLAQARHVFLGGCCLLADAATGSAPLWAGQPQWHVLETGFGLGLNFLAAWQAWRADPQRPDRLFFTSCEAWPVTADDIRRSAAPFPELKPLAEQLAAQWLGLLPGVHRLVLEQGRVQLTLCIGLAQDWLPTLDAVVDSVFLDGFNPAANPDIWSLSVLKGIGRLCRPGSRLATRTVARTVRDDLVTAGFEVEQVAGLSPTHDGLRAVHAPRWQTRHAIRPRPAEIKRHAIIVGAGLAGSAVAWSLAQRGWQVEVLDQADAPASGASGLPAGLVAPHVSPDDAALSRLSRAGLRLTLQRLAELLREGEDWGPSGVLEHRIEGKRGLPCDALWSEAGSPGWQGSRTALAQQLEQAGLPADTLAIWHEQAAWLRPAQLVRAQLDHPNIHWRGQTHIAALRREAQDGRSDWQLLDADGHVLAQAPTVVLACAHPTRALLESLDRGIPLNALRGQISWGPLSALPDVARDRLPPFPVNGHGSLISGFAGSGDVVGPAWIVGSTFERGVTESRLKAEDQIANRDRLARLLPELGQAMDTQFEPAQAWAAVRCTLPDRVPAVGAVDPQALPGLLVCAGMGARGLTLSVLCGELIAAGLHGEPWPLERRLAQAVAAARFAPPARPAAATQSP